MLKNTIAFLGMFLFFAMASQGVSYAYEYRLDDQYVSRKEYEKLQREMEELKAHMHLLLNNNRDSREAREGLTRIGQRLTEEAETARQAGDLERSLALIDQGLRIDPEGSGLHNLKAAVAEEQRALGEKRRRVVAQWLERAQGQFQSGRLTTPPGDNAFETYRMLLAVVPGQAEAVAGLEQIAERCVQLAEAAHEPGHGEASLALIDQGLQAVPGHARLAELRTALGSGQAEAIPGLLGKAEQQLVASRLAAPKGDNEKALPQQEPKRFALTPQAEIPQTKSAQGPNPSRAEAQPPAADISRSEDSQGDRQKEAEEAKRDIEEFLRRQKILFKPGELELEFNIIYGQDTAENTCFGFDVRFCAPGSPVTPKLITRTVDTGLVVRYGVIDNLEFNLRLPFGFIEQEQDFTPFEVPNPIRRRDNAGLGDISWALRYAAWREDGMLPDVNLNLDAKSITGDEDEGLGSGFWNVGGGVTLVKTIDPVVLFGSVGYTWTLERSGIDPGDQIPYSIGMGFSLNDRVSFSMSMNGAAVRRTEVNGREIGGSGQDIDTFTVGTTIQVAKHLFVEPFVGFGLTEEATDFLVGISVPYQLPGNFPLPFLPD